MDFNILDYDNRRKASIFLVTGERGADYASMWKFLRGIAKEGIICMGEYPSGVLIGNISLDDFDRLTDESCLIVVTDLREGVYKLVEPSNFDRIRRQADMFRRTDLTAYQLLEQLGLG